MRKKIRISILKGKTNNFVAVTNLQESISNPNLYKYLLKIQLKYTELINEIRKDLTIIKQNKNLRGDCLSRWVIADKIYRLLKYLEDNGFVLEDISKTFSRDLGISIRYVNYLIKFRLTYQDVKMLHTKISWDKYRELLDIPNPHLREICLSKILNNELKTRNEIRQFKRFLKSKYGSMYFQT